MRNEGKTPHMGLMVLLCTVIAAIWVLALYDTYADSKQEKYDVRVHPGAVNYGTHSSAVIPMETRQLHHSNGSLLSGSAVRQYAYNGHSASTPSSNGYRVYTTSSATVHTVGAGGGGGSMGSANSSSSSSRGIQYGNASVSMPTFALVTPNYAMQASGSSRNAIGPRKIKPSGTGEDGEWKNGGEGDSDWWYYNDWEGDWVAAEVGDLRPKGDGNFYRYDGGGVWTLVNDQGDPVTPTPVGDAPWFWMMLLAMSYGIVKVIRKKQNAI